MVRVGADEFLEWADLNDLTYLPPLFRVRTRVKIVSAKGLPEYLKKPGASSFTMAPRRPAHWPFLVSVTQEAMNKIKRRGWEPEAVEIFVRWDKNVERREREERAWQRKIDKSRR